MFPGARMNRPAVVFDLDDTLYPERMFVVGGIRAVAALIAAKYPAGPDWEKVLLDVLDSEGPFRLFDHSLSIYGVERTPELIAELVAAFRGHRPVVEPWPGIVDVLRHLRGAGIPIGLVTDGYLDVQQSKWRALGIEDLFDAVVFCADVDGSVHPKPDPAPFLKVASLLDGATGAVPSRLIYVGDNPLRDFPAPDALGWGTVRVCRPGTWHAGDPDPVADRPRASTTAELRAILDRIILNY